VVRRQLSQRVFLRPDVESNLPPFLAPWRGLLWLTLLHIDLDAQSRQPEIRRLISSAQASVTDALDGSNDTHNGRVVDVEAPGNTSQTFAVDAV
jgi:hypothetical protein